MNKLTLLTNLCLKKQFILLKSLILSKILLCSLYDGLKSTDESGTPSSQQWLLCGKKGYVIIETLLFEFSLRSKISLFKKAKGQKSLTLHATQL